VPRLQVAHGIAGWNQIEYLSNAIDSVLFYRQKSEPLFVAITGGHPSDNALIVEKYSGIEDIFIHEIIHNPRYQSKTGSLYEGNNHLFKLARDHSFRYLNLIQSDIQMLWWDQEILSHYVSIFEEFENSVQILTAFVKRGLNPGAYRSDLSDYRILEGDIEIKFQKGLGDWGFFDLERWHFHRFTWEGTEASMGETAARRGFVAPVPRLPCAADVPWPSVIRASKVIGTPIRRKERFLLRGVTEDTLAELKSTKNGTLWQEDWVKTWG